MKTRVMRIGHSRSIRISKLLLQQAGLDGDVTIEVEPGYLVIRLARQPRKGWAAAFKEMARGGEEALLDPIGATNWDKEYWEW
jgi:antitoxin MazE